MREGNLSLSFCAELVVTNRQIPSSRIVHLAQKRLVEFVQNYLKKFS